ncbi:MAG: sulfite exporter TauE/SafE family protein, partial [Pseudomonadota bacterium]|nr:sulfite exporter TauE/SafE family protein [Pseudomonadota bacterium]
RSCRAPVPDLTILSTLAADPALYAFLAVIALAGVVRGFSGFGAGMIIAPTGAALYSPQIAIIALFVLDFGPSNIMVPGAWPKVNWREVLPVALGYVLALPAGLYFLKFGDPVVLRWCISATILVVVAVLWSGWIYRGPRTPPVSVLVGSLGGFLGGAVGIGGPPAVIYWMAARTGAGNVRANLVVLFAITQLTVLAGLVVADLFTWRATVIGLAGIPVYLAGLLIGMRLFGRASEQVYRRVALVLVLAAALMTTPALDGLLAR